VGWSVHERENPELAVALIREAVEREGADTERLVLHSDNGGPMKGGDAGGDAGAVRDPAVVQPPPGL
jgi:transposase InsO family protein